MRRRKATKAGFLMCGNIQVCGTKYVDNENRQTPNGNGWRWHCYISSISWMHT